MARFSLKIPNFNGGELSPKLEGRTDIPKYAEGAARVENFVVAREGPLVRRSGTRFVKEVVDSTRKTRLIPFIFSTEQAYILEFSDLLIRVYANEGPVLDGPTHVSIVSPFTEAQLFQLHYVQSADVLYLVHPNHHPQKLLRFSHISWSLQLLDLTNGPFLGENTTSTTFTINAASGVGRILTASSTIGINRDQGFLVGQDEGRLIRYNDDGNNPDAVWGVFRITNVNSPTQVTGDWLIDTTTSSVSPRWRLGAWYTGNYPAAISFFEQRLAMAGEPDTPQILHASRTGIFESFQPTGDLVDASTAAPDDRKTDEVFDDNGFDFALGSNQVNSIVWLAASRNLHIGTPGGIYPVQASTANEAVTPTNVNVPQASVIGTSSIQPQTVNNRILYISRNGRRCHALRFSFEVDNVVSDDVTLLADHILRSGAVELAYTQEPESLLWVVRNDGILACLTYVPDQELFAWSRHQIGGSFQGGRAVVESAAAIPSPEEDHDQLWIIVKRTINGMTKRYIEFLEEPWETETGATLDEAFFVDSGLTYDDTVGPPTSGVSNINHLEGETVSVLTDGATHGDRVVTAGAITLDGTFQTIHVGLPYTSEMETLRLELPDRAGASHGKAGRIEHVVMRFLETVGGKIGPSLAALDPIVHRDPLDPMDQPPDLFTGDTRQLFRAGWDRTKKLVIRQDQPVPMTLLAITLQGQTGER